jgi:hypothetical protein
MHRSAAAISALIQFAQLIHTSSLLMKNPPVCTGGVSFLKQHQTGYQPAVLAAAGAAAAAAL